MIIVGIDVHSRSHSAAAVDAQGRLLDSLEVGAGPTGLEQLCEWLARFEQPRLVAVENARGYGLALVRRLLLAGEEVVDVPAARTGDGRRRSGQRGKDDEGDALVVARVGLRDQEHLPRLEASVLDDELKLLVDAREQRSSRPAAGATARTRCSASPRPAIRHGRERSPPPAPSAARRLSLAAPNALTRPAAGSRSMRSPV